MLALRMSILLLACCSFLHADLIYLRNGSIVWGSVVDETDEFLYVDTKAGEREVAWADVLKIEEVADAADLAEKRLAALGRRDVDGRIKLAQFLEQIGAEPEALDVYRELLKLDPDNSAARFKLGYLFVKDHGWVTEEQAAEIERLRGGGLEGEPGEGGVVAAPRFPNANKRVLELLKLANVLDSAARSRALDALAGIEQGITRELRDGLADPDQKVQYAAYKTLRRCRELGLPDAYEEFSYETAEELDGLLSAYVAANVTAPLVAGLESAIDKRVKEHNRLVERASALIPDFRVETADTKRADSYAAWVEARDAALEVIFDLSIYPDENHGKVGQPVVDEHVDKVRAIWERYDQMVEHDVAAILSVTPEQAIELQTTMRQCQDLIGAFADFLRGYQVEVAYTLGELPAPIQALVLYRSGHLEEAYAVQKRLEGHDAYLVRRMSDARVEAYNDSLLELDAPQKGVIPTTEEREQVRITNDYRIMMGRPSVEISLTLTDCARGHSAEMTQLGYFAHESPNPDRRSPSDRARLAGYPGGAAENISLGSPAPMATHIAWYNSSGHHRNILGAGHRCMGAGKDGRHWTQNFGSLAVLKR